MAQTKRNDQVLGIFCLVISTLLLVHNADAFQFTVGGPRATWEVPTDATFYNHWAENNRFRIGDSLLFVYAANQDSLLQVTRDDYTNCNTASPIQRFTDGHTVFRFNQSGPHYFISGESQNCHNNEKLIVVVLTDRNRNHPAATPPPASPPAPAPAAEAVPPPSPAPAANSSPPPPPEVHPAAAPGSSHPQNHNAASSTVASIGGILGILVASSLM